MWSQERFAGSGFRQAAQRIDDYAATAGVFRERIKGVDGRQEGDPTKAAAAIMAVTRAENPPLRLPLGKTAVATLTAKLASVQHDLDAYRAVAESAVF